MPEITIRYFALLREQRGRSEEFCCAGADNAASLYEALKDLHGFSLDQTHVRVAVNGRMQEWHTPIKDGDVVSFIPPVAGG